MKSITITPILDPEDNPAITGKGATLTECILDLLRQIRFLYAEPRYGDLVMTKFFEGFTAILEANEEGDTGFVFQHRDFSCPEDQFDMSYTCEEGPTE